MTDVSALRAKILAQPLEFEGSVPMTWEYDCRICLQDRTGKYSSYRVHVGEKVICLRDWNYAHDWHTAEEKSAYIDYLVEVIAWRGDL